MKTGLHLKTTQHLAMTPQLQQSIRLLQLSALELQQEVAQALLDNPMLEREEQDDADETPDADHASDHADHSNDNITDEPLDTCEAFAQNTPVDLDEGPYDYSDYSAASDTDESGNGSERDYTTSSGSTGNSDFGDFAREQADPHHLTLREHLLAQAGLLRISQREQALLRILIEALDERGYLASSLNDILSSLPPEAAVTEPELVAALACLQKLDPPGVGARDLSECLCLQLRESSAAANHPATVLARQIITDYLPALAQRDFALLHRKTRAKVDALRAAQDLIRSLNPRPGDAFLDNASPYVIPDVLVRRRAAGDWQARINPDALPRLSINRLYADLLRRSDGPHGGLSGQLQEARWFIKNLQQRFETIERVAQAIVTEQAAFFEQGELAMRPLVLRDIAEQLGLHESTISRVTTQKFMATPRGILEFKYFFGSHVATDDGSVASATAIKARIRQMIDGENPQKPLSDQQICTQFGATGIVVARRTIAKYREALGLPTASLRKTL